jgi:putative RNA 2'-phosphotransferase
MNDTGELKHISKLLSLVLRHAPETIGVDLDTQGWADVDQLLARAAEKGTPITRAQLDAVVRTSDKQRFALSVDGRRIRANQGHSLTTVDLQLTASAPPAQLYHGTADRFLDAIRAQGLRPGARQHVHLSREQATATTVGARHGRAVVLTVDAGQMQRQGYLFYLSANGVWLTDAVPPAFITFPAQVR